MSERELRRIHIVGGPGSGKTTLGRELSQLIGVPVHHLDDVARVGGGNGPVRDDPERTELVESILACGEWITEGVHLGWTEPLLDQADIIVWLDPVEWSGASTRLVRRFATGAMSELRARRGRERFLRLHDHAREVAGLIRSLRESRHYYEVEPPAGQGLDSRESTRARLERYRPKLVRCANESEVAALEVVLVAGARG